MKELPQEGSENMIPNIANEIMMDDQRAIEYRRYIMSDIISLPEEMWVKKARLYFLEVRDHINGTSAIGPWLDSMISLKYDLARMGGIEEMKNE